MENSSRKHNKMNMYCFETKEKTLSLCVSAQEDAQQLARSAEFCRRRRAELCTHAAKLPRSVYKFYRYIQRQRQGLSTFVFYLGTMVILVWMSLSIQLWVSINRGEMAAKIETNRRNFQILLFNTPADQYRMWLTRNKSPHEINQTRWFMWQLKCLSSWRPYLDNITKEREKRHFVYSNHFIDQLIINDLFGLFIVVTSTYVLRLVERFAIEVKRWISQLSISSYTWVK